MKAILTEHGDPRRRRRNSDTKRLKNRLKNVFRRRVICLGLHAYNLRIICVNAETKEKVSDSDGSNDAMKMFHNPVPIRNFKSQPRVKIIIAYANLNARIRKKKMSVTELLALQKKEKTVRKNVERKAQKAAERRRREAAEARKQKAAEAEKARKLQKPRKPRKACRRGRRRSAEAEEARKRRSENVAEEEGKTDIKGKRNWTRKKMVQKKRSKLS
ncbi:hypothetical protein CTI12_AA613990 [Artemisia annua]|uniref:Uncharacterized protein n=1 Tax=Artemisia annua TaxID=35608 RepID=A0A2U1KE22_ARTAN|nr:hypothetical protein CTI12_AA613990 [Artemisia annua]